MRKTLTAALFLVAFSINCFADNRDTYKTISYEVEQPGATSEVSVDFPVDVREPVRTAVIDYIFETLRAFKGDALPNTPAPKNCTEAVVKPILSQFTETLASWYGGEQQEYAASLAEEGETYDVLWYINIAVNKAAETPQYVSYTSYLGDFQGGAHGQSYSDAITIRKSDGKRIKDIFRDGVEAQIQPLLWKYLLIDYESEEDKQEYRNGIMDYLDFQNTDIVPLPEVSYLAPDGVHLTYQYYEICPWAMGAPDPVIPYSEALPYLTKEAAQLVKSVKTRR
ncbi:MAG: DUF3298 domain-containing protein [Prevotella sp.]|nr:DUF3298 domain-containing protein [Prevotella sp.]